LPNVGFLPANKSPNTGPKKIVWFNDEIHPMGEVLDACDLISQRSVVVPSELIGMAGPGYNDQMAEIAEQFMDDVETAFLRVEPQAFKRLASCLLSKRFLIATGLAGSGKTNLAQAFARWMTPSSMAEDVFSPGSEIQSANVTYYVKKSDTLSVEFWNAANEDDATKVTLPRQMIAEWAAYIESNSIPQTTQAREIREAVKVTSKFSDQLHSFETHLKAAAFALVNSKIKDATGSCCAVVPVGADWTGSENILGYPDGLQRGNYVTKPTVDLILHAEAHADVPHFLILDEMNLSHVERYFADILSIIESNEGLELYSGDMTRPESWRKTPAVKPVPPKLKQLPANLFIIGTVNVDETTYMFSPKVLDRANVIEFRMDAGELEGFLGNPAKPNLSKLDGKGAAFGKAFVDAAKNPAAVPADVKAAYDAEMLLLFKTLQAHGAEFGYRTAYETARFIHFYKLLGNHADGDTPWFPGAFDCVVFQKLLPKLHGSRAKLGPVLKKLWFLCVNGAAGRGADALKAAEETKAEPNKDALAGAYYPMSAEKIYRMWRLMMDNGFASFAEA
jgi:tRNA A37 threonylcarbamoyladenosine biosynthesis protein TsaE